MIVLYVLFAFSLQLPLCTYTTQVHVHAKENENKKNKIVFKYFKGLFLHENLQKSKVKQKFYLNSKQEVHVYDRHRQKKKTRSKSTLQKCKVKRKFYLKTKKEVYDRHRQKKNEVQVNFSKMQSKTKVLFEQQRYMHVRQSICFSLKLFFCPHVWISKLTSEQ